MHVCRRRLRAGEAITNVPGENVMVSCNGRYRLALNADGNLVRPPGRPRVVSIDVAMMGQYVFVVVRSYLRLHRAPSGPVFKYIHLSRAWLAQDV